MNSQLLQQNKLQKAQLPTYFASLEERCQIFHFLLFVRAFLRALIDTLLEISFLEVFKSEDFLRLLNKLILSLFFSSMLSLFLDSK